MITLLIIADDLTGALDTGTQFAKQGIKTLVTTDIDIEMSDIDPNIEVLVVDTETRHKNPNEAYEIVFSLAKKATDGNIKHIYKKIDSVFRGNPGSELLAAMNGAGSKKLMFVPAYPDNGRTTVDGIQYVSGVPVAESHFVYDPRSPVMNSYIPDLIKQNTDVKTKVITSGEETDFNDFYGIMIFDAKTNEDMVEIGCLLNRARQLYLTAGCAGFAGILCNILTFTKHNSESINFGDNILIVSGSVNKTSIKQMEHLKKTGSEGFTLTPGQKQKKDAGDSTQIKELTGFIKDTLTQKGSAYIEAVGSEASIIDADPSTITNNIGVIVKQVADEFPIDNLFVIGGDTLLGVMEQLGINELIPMLELSPGVVLSKVLNGKYTFNLITKSGGFGHMDAVSNVLSTLLSRRQKI